MADPETKGKSRKQKVIFRAHKRFAKCQAWERIARARWKDDKKFANGDSYNNYQWPSAIYNSRGGRPSLTVNQTRQHNLHIINEAKQNNSGVKFRPTGDDATYDASQVWEGLYRNAANVSNLQMHQGVAITNQVEAGLGFTRIKGQFVDQKGFDQQVVFCGVEDPMSCMMDCDSRELDGSDAMYAFIFNDRDREAVEIEYPQLVGKMSPDNAVDDGVDDGWYRENLIRECEYWEVTEKKDTLYGTEDGLTVLKSDIPSELLEQWQDEIEAENSTIRSREVVTKTVHWYKIVGDIIVEDHPCPGTSVPIIPWVGEVTIIDGEMDRKGHTRSQISAQQMINYNWSASVEYGALQSKTPWLAPASAIEGLETYWKSANVENHSVLAWNHRDDEGRDIPAPTRMQPPQTSPVFAEGVQMANQFMQASSGQYQAELGAPGNEKSGIAIQERKRQADRATYHFVDNQALAIRRQGQLFLEYVPVIMDTKRAERIIDGKGDETSVQVDPDAQAAHMKTDAAIMDIFNPNIGNYDVVSDVGPDYATQRQEAFEAISQILVKAPELVQKIGDLLFKVADFPLANEIAERLKPGVPQDVQEAMSKLQEQLTNKNRLLSEAMQALTEERLNVKAKDSQSDIDAFKADTDRTKMLIEQAGKVNPQLAEIMIRTMAPQTVHQSMQDNLGPVGIAASANLKLGAMNLPPPGATGAVPAPVPNPGQAAATPGGA